MAHEDHHRIVLTGGGTGGHIYPALSVAEKLSGDPEVEDILYIGAAGHLEERLAADRGLRFVGLEVAGLPRTLSPRLLTWPFTTFQAVAKARSLLKEFRPTCVLGTGGYASAAPLIAALTMNIPFAVHEPDAHPGLVNRSLGKFASLVSLGMEGARGGFAGARGEVLVLGNPVSERFVDTLPPAEARRSLGLDPDLRTIVVTGGSQGAAAINESLREALPELLEKNIQIIHQAGDRNLESFRESLHGSILSDRRYCLRPYFEDMALVYAASDFAVSRAGAMTIAELAVTGTTSIFIPYPYAAQNHQMHNARALETRGAAAVIDQQDLDGKSLASAIFRLLDEPGLLAAMNEAMKSLGKPDAARDLAGKLKNLSSKI
ncbi:MAG: undecaprenyldiphospho-muramoylpentapeptide beta-N-acetylglucosaminyltransferase [Candidatus Obscuribacterales bacterium]